MFHYPSGASPALLAAASVGVVVDLLASLEPAKLINVWLDASAAAFSKPVLAMLNG